MAQSANQSRPSWMPVVGFACTQAYLCSILDSSNNRLAKVLDEYFVGLDLIIILAFMAFGFTFIMAFRRSLPRNIIPKSAIAAVCILAAVFMVISLFVQNPLLSVALEGMWSGLACSFLLTAWSKVLSTESIDDVVPTVFTASAVGAGLCLAIEFGSFAWSSYIAVGFPIISVLLLPAFPDAEEPFLPKTEQKTPRKLRKQKDKKAKKRASSSLLMQYSPLVMRTLAAAMLYGLATGLMVAYERTWQQPEEFTSVFFLIIFALYCLASLQLYGSKGKHNEVLPHRSDVEMTEDGPLDGSYRLAILILMAGFLVMPLTEVMGIKTEAIVLGGYLGIVTVLISLFLVMGHIGGSNPVTSLTRGLATLMMGEVVGIIIGNTAYATVTPESLIIVVVVASILALYAYLFVFTDRDLRMLSVAMESRDYFDEATSMLTSRYKLSKRESEVLIPALRGRTAERIAQELFISKNTVDTHLRRIYSKCDVHSRQELIDLELRIENELKDKGTTV